MAHGAGDSQLLAGCRALLGNSQGPAQEAATIAFDNRLEPAERMTRLHALRENKAARIAERYFYARLEAGERERPEFLKLIVESRLEQRQFAQALTHVDKLLEQQADPQVLMWRAWCLYSLDRAPEALDVLRQIEENHAGDPWQKPAGELASRIRDLAPLLEEHAKLLAAALVQLRDDGPGLLELRAKVKGGNDLEYEVYGGYDAGREHIEASLAQSGTVILAYRVTAGSAQLYIQGEPAIQQFPGRGVIPIPRIGLVRSNDGRFQISSSVQFNTPFSGGEQQETAALLQSPWLTTPDGLAAMLKQLLPASGWCAGPVADDDSGRRLEWSRPRLDGPGLESVSIHIDQAGRIDALQADRLSEFRLRYGPADAFEIDPPAWPELPVEARDRMDPAVWFRVLASVMSLVSDQSRSAAP
jgi:hypothetical protein